MDNTLSVLQLNTYLNRIMQSEELLQNISVYGEISSYKFSGPHAYFTLKDKDAQIQCNCFNAKKTYVPISDGESVIVRGSMDYYIKGGRLSLNISTIQPVGKGMLHI
ncbi:MAG: exodeoxyribonuclease VII large subunit, partial [Clostridia bacterium]|nr:exodeoxyribonuclease VII large subunit [Clostridia bacterium]